MPESVCDHEKIYAPITLLTNPPQYPWVCRKCGAGGRDSGVYYDTLDYETVRRKFGRAHEPQLAVEKREESK